MNGIKFNRQIIIIIIIFMKLNQNKTFYQILSVPKFQKTVIITQLKFFKIENNQDSADRIEGKIDYFLNIRTHLNLAQ